MIYGVYGKKVGDKRFKGFDMKNNTFIVNRIHLSIFAEHELFKLKAHVDYMNEHNKGYKFEIRELT